MVAPGAKSYSRFAIAEIWLIWPLANPEVPFGNWTVPLPRLLR